LDHLPPATNPAESGASAGQSPLVSLSPPHLVTFLPVGAYGGRLRVFAGEAVAFTEVGEPVLVVSHQAQRLAEVLADRGVPALLADRLEAPPRPGAVTLLRGDLG